MKCHLGWIRVAAAAAIMAGGPQAGAQYAPYRPLPQQTPPPVATAPAVAPMQQQVVAPRQGAPVVAPQQRPVTPSQHAVPVVPGVAPGPMTYAPYRPQPQQQAVAPQAAPTQQAAATPYRAPAVAYPQVATAYPQVAGAYASAATTYAPSPTAAYPQTADRYSPYYSTVAQDSNGQLPPPEQDGTLPPPEANGVESNGAPTNGEPMNGVTNGAPDGAANGVTNGHNGHHGHNGHSGMPNGYNGAAMPMLHGFNGYPTTNYAAGACDQGGYSDYGLSGYFDNPCHDTQWFGGVYFLWMERDNASPVKLTARVDHSTASDPYYPLGHTTVLSTPGYDYREGVEIRFGSTFTIGDSCDDCSSGCGTGYGYGYNGAGCNTCATSCPDVYAWEAAWWAIDDDLQQDSYADANPTLADQVRIYGMVNFTGLEYDRDGDGTYDNTVNSYYGYQLPIDAPPGAPAPDGYVIVLAQRVRQNFNAQNVELNLIRFPMCEASCGGCSTGCDAGGCGDAGYTGVGCEADCCPSAFSMYGSCGVRYFRAEDEFMYASEFGEYTGGVIDQASADGWNGGPNELYYSIDVENHLVGGQLGWTMNYCVASKWNFFANSTFGVFNNHINHYQRVYGGGPVRHVQNGETARTSSDKDDISFLGELRLGGSYDITCNWRAVAAYRAVAVTGIANSTDQIPSDFSSSEYVAIIDSDSSLIVHGLQVGAECRY